jgi:hypothetical protein
MSGRRALVFALAGLAVHVLLLSGAGALLPLGVRLVLAFTVLVLLPGHGWLAAVGVCPPGGAWLASGWALGLGVLALASQVLLVRALGLPFTILHAWSAVAAALAWLAAWRLAPRSRGDATPGLPPAALAAVALAALVAAVHVGQLGTPLSYYTDSPDHIGTIRRMLASGDPFPVDAFFRDAGAQGADPRKGLWHPCVALVTKLAAVDPVDAWRLLGALLAPLFVLNAAAFATLLGGPAFAAAGAWGLLLTYGSSLAMPPLREAVFATKLADQLALATIAAVLADLGAARPRTRVAAVALALGTVVTHVFGALQFAVVFAALGAGMLARDRAWSSPVRRLAVTAMALGLACLPYLAWRAGGAYAPSNPIHLEPQGLMHLPGGAFVVSPGVLWDWMGPLWLVFPLSLVAWARGSERPAVLALLTTTFAVFGLMFLPPVVGVLQPKLGYLLMRFVWMLPLSAALAYAGVELTKAALGGGGVRRIAAIAGLLALAAGLRAPVLDALHVLANAREVADAEARTSVLRWRDALAWMDARLPEGSVVMSDPATSYAVPMLTRHWVQTLVDQHSSPNDSLALDRILDARDALDPYATWTRTGDVIRRWGVTHVVLNARFDEIPRLDYWAPEPAWFAAARARLDGAPGAFVRRYHRDGFVVYEVRPESLAVLEAPPVPRPFVRPAGPADPDGFDLGAGLPRLSRFALSTHAAAPGDTLVAVLEWRARARAAAGSYSVSVRFDRPLPDGWSPPALVGKPARKLLERSRGERYRFRVDHIPLDGAYGVDLWSPGEIVRDSVALAVPHDVAAGTYSVQVSLRREPHYANYHLGDYFFDRDYYAGVAVDTLRLSRPERDR